VTETSEAADELEKDPSCADSAHTIEPLIISEAVVEVPEQPPALLSEDTRCGGHAAATETLGSNLSASFRALGNNVAANFSFTPIATDSQVANLTRLEEQLNSTGASLSRSIEEVAHVLSQQMQLLQDLQNRIDGPLPFLPVQDPAASTTPPDVGSSPSSNHEPNSDIAGASTIKPNRWCHRFVELSDTKPLAKGTTQERKASGCTAVPTSQDAQLQKAGELNSSGSSSHLGNVIDVDDIAEATAVIHTSVAGAKIPKVVQNSSSVGSGWYPSSMKSSSGGSFAPSLRKRQFFI